MVVYPISVRSFLLMMALCLCGARALAASQIASPQVTILGGGYRIAGTVVSKADAHPLSRARIFMRDALDQRKFQSVVTSENGKFEFSGLPAGKYSLEGAKRGFISAGYEQHDQFSTAIVTGAGLDSESLVLRLAPDAVITGKILDETGEPVRHAMVTLYYVDHSGGLDQIHQFSNAQTDDQGMYEITPLIPLVAPFAPHIAEELWEKTGSGTGSVFDSAWPSFDPALAAEDSIELVVQVNGKVRSKITVPRDIAEEAAVVAALADPAVAKFVAGAPKKIIFVPGRLLNIVA